MSPGGDITKAMFLLASAPRFFSLTPPAHYMCDRYTVTDLAVRRRTPTDAGLTASTCLGHNIL
jgi:hypothetical protein